MPVARPDSPAGQLPQRQDSTADMPPVGASLLAIIRVRRCPLHGPIRRQASSYKDKTARRICPL